MAIPAIPPSAPYVSLGYIEARGGFFDGINDDSALINRLSLQAIAAGKHLLLPPKQIALGATCTFQHWDGFLGETELVLLPSFTFSGFNNQFALINPNFATGFVSTADSLSLRDIKITRNTLNAGKSLLGMGNVREGLFQNLDITANRGLSTSATTAISSIAGGATTTITANAHGITIGDPAMVSGVTGTIASAINGFVGTATGVNTVTLPINTTSLTGTGGVVGRPVSCDTCLDLYAGVKNVVIDNVKADNLTQGKTGSAIWVRNLCTTSNAGISLSASVIDSYATENIEIKGGQFRQTATDEVIAVYGVNGITRKVKIHHMDTKGLATLDDGTANPIQHVSLLSTFPLHNTGEPVNAGVNAAVYEVIWETNTIEDRAFSSEVIRFGNSSDASNKCYDIKSRGNIVDAYASSNSVATSVIRNIETAANHPGMTYSGNNSENDTCNNMGSLQVGYGVNGFSSVINPTTTGNLNTGVGGCSTVLGGTIEAVTRCLYNNTYAEGCQLRCNSEFYGIVFDGSTQAAYYLRNIFLSVAGGVDNTGGGVSITSAASNLSTLEMSGVRIGMNASAGFGISNAKAGFTVNVDNCSVDGVASGFSTGAGGINKRSGNRFLTSLDDKLTPTAQAQQTAAFTLALSANKVITGIAIANSTANAITGGLKIGTTAGGTDVLATVAVGANATVFVPADSLLKQFFSTSASQTLYFDAVGAWNSASISITVLTQVLT